jgi:hypothetical protein
MATVRRSNFDWNGQPYWGLVQQNGPWSSTPGDIKRANEKDIPAFGGGIGVGGRKHAGHSIFESFMTPYQINATGAPPPPSGYARPTVMMGSVDMKRATKMGRAKQGLTLAARTPLQTGYKMGGGKEDIIQTEAGDIMPPIVVEGTTQFGSTHHIMEMPSLLSPSSTASTPAYINELATNLRTDANNAGYGDTDSHVTGYTNMFRSPSIIASQPSGRFYGPSRNLDNSFDTYQTTSPTTATSYGSMAPMTNPVPDPILTYYPIEIPDVPIEIEEPETVDYPIEYQSPDIVDTTMTQNLNMSQGFLNSLADYDKAQMARMQKKRDSFKEPAERPIGVPTGKGKKTALDGTFLAEEANRGLTDGKSKPMSQKAKGKRPAPIITSPTESKPASTKTPSPVRKTAGPSKPTSSKPPSPVFKFKPEEEIPSPKPSPKPARKPASKTGKVGKKTKPFQIPATAGRVNGVLKRYKDTIPQVWKETNTDAENFLIIDAAYKKYLKEKKDKKKK